MMFFACGFLMTLILMGCAHKQEQLVVKKIETRQLKVPESLLECMSQPEAAAAWKSQKDVAIFMLRLAEAGDDCRQKNGAIKRLLGENN